MTNLVECLRAEAQHKCCRECSIEWLAADYIERIEAENTRLQDLSTRLANKVEMLLVQKEKTA